MHKLQVKPINLVKLDTFSGLGKGFFQSTSSGGEDTSTAPAGGTPHSAASSRAQHGEEIEEIAPRKPGERVGELAEVQEAMAQAAPFLEARKSEWCTPGLIEKLEKVRVHIIL